ncbi:FAD/NAD(P)-binding protein [Rugosimonospora africana]|uniref:Pyridine nucleotide-disulfide oxidoreductase n=1 Tax=Rugosimonospora africana TaxID=556532 RepID=A0A8J3VVX9_9ACTN|nr:FAD/NAD(P)-binding protein [Rugosimonospora africana]GIH20158.1 pyridine nucleotide-disulfide oxidoreductase [Rugosimonospora africana]
MGRTSTVVVGGGCSGVLAAVQLLRHGTGRVTMVEPDTTLGAGVAYRTPVAAHVLNSRAATMSGDPEDPDDFLAWTRRRGIPLRAAGFAVRRDYGRYLHDLLDAAAVDNPGRFTHVRARVTGLGLGAGIQILTDGGTALRADRVVLAIGHTSPSQPHQLSDSAAGHPGYVPDPWRPGALDAIPLERPVLLLGTGLTAVDVALALQIRGMRAPIHAISRHGLLPLVHTAEPTTAPIGLPPTADSLAAVIRQLRQTARRAADWRDIVDGTRPTVNALWAGLSLEDRRRFLRHACRYWEIHRHRMAPSVAVVVRGMLADGALRVQAATLSTVTAEAEQLLVEARSGTRWRVGTVVNCTGRGSAARSALGRRLLADGLARPDPLGVGVDVDADGRLVSAAGRGHDRILVIGALRRGQWWETDAVPEIRAQARGLLRVAAPHPRIAA